MEGERFVPSQSREGDTELIAQLFALEEGKEPTDAMVAAFERSPEFQKIMSDLREGEKTFEKVMAIVQGKRDSVGPGFDQAMARIEAEKVLRNAKGAE